MRGEIEPKIRKNQFKTRQGTRNRGTVAICAGLKVCHGDDAGGISGNSDRYNGMKIITHDPGSFYVLKKSGRVIRHGFGASFH